jgi:hypothetical protein
MYSTGFNNIVNVIRVLLIQCVPTQILASYFLLLPLRDEAGVSLGVPSLPTGPHLVHPYFCQRGSVSLFQKLFSLLEREREGGREGGRERARAREREVGKREGRMEGDRERERERDGCLQSRI